jgi:hypothetical protein
MDEIPYPTITTMNTVMMRILPGGMLAASFHIRKPARPANRRNRKPNSSCQRECKGFTAVGTTVLTNVPEFRTTGIQSLLACFASLPAARPAILPAARIWSLSTTSWYQKEWLYLLPSTCTIKKTSGCKFRETFGPGFASWKVESSEKGAELGRTSQEPDARSGKCDQ